MYKLSENDIKEIQNFQMRPLQVDVDEIITIYMQTKETVFKDYAEKSADGNVSDDTKMAFFKDLHVKTLIEQMCAYEYLTNAFAAVLAYENDFDENVSTKEFHNIIIDRFFTIKFASLGEYRDLIASGDVDNYGINEKAAEEVGILEIISSDLENISKVIEFIMSFEADSDGTLIEQLNNVILHENGLRDLLEKNSIEALHNGCLMISAYRNENGRFDWGIKVAPDFVKAHGFFSSLEDLFVPFVTDVPIDDFEKLGNGRDSEWFMSEFVSFILGGIFELETRQLALTLVELLHVRLRLSFEMLTRMNPNESSFKEV